jgi:hypothetical protein
MMNEVNDIAQRGQSPPLLPQLIADIIFLRQLFGNEDFVSLYAPAGQLIAAYLAANRAVIQTVIDWFYENTTEEQRYQLSEQNVMADPSTIHEGFKKIALHVLWEANELAGMLDGQITMDNLRMLLRGLQTVEAHGEFDRTTHLGQLYRLLISPVEAIWPAWEKAYAG